MTAHQNAIIRDLNRLDSFPVVPYWGSIGGTAHESMLDAAEAQYQKIHDLIASGTLTNEQIQRSISNIEDSLAVYRDRIQSIKENPEELFGPIFPGATVQDVTLGLNRENPRLFPRTLALFESLVNDIEKTIPQLNDMRSRSWCHLI